MTVININWDTILKASEMAKVYIIRQDICKPHPTLTETEREDLQNHLIVTTITTNVSAQRYFGNEGDGDFVKLAWAMVNDWRKWRERENTAITYVHPITNEKLRDKIIQGFWADEVKVFANNLDVRSQELFTNWILGKSNREFAEKYSTTVTGANKAKTRIIKRLRIAIGLIKFVSHKNIDSEVIQNEIHKRTALEYR